MKNAKFFANTVKNTVRLLLLGVILLLPITVAAQTLPTSRGTAKQLEGTTPRNWQEWHWGVGGTAVDLEPTSEMESIYELTHDDDLDWEARTQSDNWLNLNRGDTSRGSVRTTIIRF